MTTLAENGGGLFQRGEAIGDRTDGPMFPALPTHGEYGNQDAPLGSGIMILFGLGAAYFVGKKSKEE